MDIKKNCCSRNRWDGKIEAWTKPIHKYGQPEEEKEEDKQEEKQEEAEV